MKKLRFGLIGFSQGFYATTYTKSILQRKDVEVVACCDLGMPADYVRECAFVTAKDFCTEIKAPLVHDLDQFFGFNLDVVMVATEVWEHKKYTLEALRNNCHVFVGKPLSFCADEVREVMKVAREKGLLVLPGQPLRYEQGLSEAASRVSGGEIGKPTNIRLFLNHEAMVHQEWERDPIKSGGPLGTFGIYLFDLIRWLTKDEFREVFSYGDNFVFPQISTYDTVQISARLASGALANMNLVSTITWPFPFVMLDVVGTKGVLRTNYDNYQTVVQGLSGTTLGESRYSAMGSREINHFIDCCLGIEKPTITLEDMVQAALGIDAVAKSIKTGQRIIL